MSRTEVSNNRMSQALRTVSVAVYLLVAVGVIFTVISPEWERTAVRAAEPLHGGTIDTVGLWQRCTTTNMVLSCDMYGKSTLALRSQLHGMRAMMCISTLCSVIAVIAAIMGLPCAAALNDKQKLLTSRAAGFLEIITGILCLIAVSWYAADVVAAFWKLSGRTNPQEFGAALYVGWIASGLALVSGTLMLCCTCGKDDDQHDDYRYAYKPPSKPTGQQHHTEYV